MDVRNDISPFENINARVSGFTLLQKSFSIRPRALARPPEEITRLKPGEIKDLYLQIVDYERRKKGPESVIQEERVIQEYLEGNSTVAEDVEFGSDLDEERYLESAKGYIRRVLDSEKGQYDSVSGLAFYTDEMRNKIVKSLLRQRRIYGGIPQYKVIVTDVNHLHEINQTYGPEQGDRVLAAVGDGIKDGVGNLSFDNDSEVFAGRMKGTGDTFIVVVLGGENGEKKVEDVIKDYPYNAWNADVLRTGTPEVLTPSVRIDVMNSLDMDTDMDLGGMLDAMVKQAQTQVDTGGHERKINA